MNSSNKLFQIQNKKAAISTLWIFVMFCIAYADIIGFIEPGTLENIINGNFGFELTPMLTIVISLIQVLPIAMIPLARWLRRNVNRWLNIAVALITTIYVLGGGNWQSASYPVFAVLEIGAMLGILWLSWTWRKDEE